MRISEGDRKLFRALRKTALQRLCQPILDERVATCRAAAASPHARCGWRCGLSIGQDRDDAPTFGQMPRSPACMQPELHRELQ
ncbi:MAG TPA: hypothetical protein VFG73_01670 [Rhodanobacteraceae bacterium]|nr:hypothetical protein [Rhodanobacteraceae bacterium]